MLTTEQSACVWRALLQQKPMDGLGLARKDGRWDLSGLKANPPTPVQHLRLPTIDAVIYSGMVELRYVDWYGLDFSQASLRHLQFLDCRLEDCVFDGADCRDWRLWRSGFVDCGFRHADLRGAALGASPKGKRNLYRRVDFTGANFRGGCYTAAAFEECAFDHARLEKVHFGASAFTRCTFAGRLSEVEFYRTAHDCPKLPPNEMREVDFRRAELRWVAFRGLDLDEVLFPEDENHLILIPYVERIERVLAAVQDRSDVNGRVLIGLFEDLRKWVGPNQKRGVLNKLDLIESVGQAETERVWALLQG